MNNSTNLKTRRRNAVYGIVALTVLSMGSVCPLASLLTGSSSSSTPVSTFPTLGPTVTPTATATATATAAVSATPTTAPAATNTPLPPPTLDLANPISPSTQTQGLAITITGTNLNGTTSLVFSSVSSVFTPVTINSGFVVASDGLSISLLVPNLGPTSASDVQVTVTTPSGFVTSSSTGGTSPPLFTYNP